MNGYSYYFEPTRDRIEVDLMVYMIIVSVLRTLRLFYGETGSILV